MPIPTSGNGTPESHFESPLLELSDDLTARILLRLKSREIAAAALSCRRIASVCADDARVWQPLCKATWSPFTDPERWLQPGTTLAGPSIPVAPGGPGRTTGGDEEDEEDDKPLTTYRSVFSALRRLQPLIGLWRGSGDAPRGSLFRVGWAPGGEGHVEVVALKAARAEEGAAGGDEAGDAARVLVAEEVLARVGPAFPGLALQLVDESLAVLKDRPWMRRDVRWSGGRGAAPAGGGSGGGGRAPSATALAAAAVATGGCGGGSELLGASPPKSFGYEMLRFMQLSVAGSRSSARKSRNRGGSAGSAPGPAGPFGACGQQQAQILQHLKRLSIATATRQRPLGGFWTGVYGPHGPEIVSIAYGGSGSRTRIEATKITGDPNVPAGQVTFWTEPDPLPHPWPLREVELITNRAHFTADPAAALAAAVLAVGAEAAAALPGPGPQPAHPSSPGGAPGVLAMPVWAMPWLEAAAEAVHEHDAAATEAQMQARLEAVATAAAAADPVEPWDYLGPPPLAPLGPLPSQAAGPASAVAVRQEQQQRPLRVVAVFQGSGRVAGPGFANAKWVDGRLWVYDNGTIGFLWLGGYDFLVDLERMSPRLLGRSGA